MAKSISAMTFFSLDQLQHTLASPDTAWLGVLQEGVRKVASGLVKYHSVDVSA